MPPAAPCACRASRCRSTVLTNPASPHHLAAAFEHDIGIRLNGKEQKGVEEYCISEGWIKLPAGKTLDRKGQPLLIKLKGKVEAFYR